MDIILGEEWHQLCEGKWKLVSAGGIFVDCGSLWLCSESGRLYQTYPHSCSVMQVSDEFIHLFLSNSVQFKILAFWKRRGQFTSNVFKWNLLICRCACTFWFFIFVTNIAKFYSTFSNAFSSLLLDNCPVLIAKSDHLIYIGFTSNESFWSVNALASYSISILATLVIDC